EDFTGVELGHPDGAVTDRHTVRPPLTQRVTVLAPVVTSHKPQAPEECLSRRVWGLNRLCHCRRHRIFLAEVLRVRAVESDQQTWSVRVDHLDAVDRLNVCRLAFG